MREVAEGLGSSIRTVHSIGVMGAELSSSLAKQEFFLGDERRRRGSGDIASKEAAIIINDETVGPAVPDIFDSVAQGWTYMQWTVMHRYKTHATLSRLSRRNVRQWP